MTPDGLDDLRAEIDAINAGEHEGCVSIELGEGDEPPAPASRAAFEATGR